MANKKKTSQKKQVNQKKQTKNNKKMNLDTAIIILIVAGLLSGTLIYFKSGYIRTDIK